MWLKMRPQKIPSTLEAPFPLRTPESVFELFSNIICMYAYGAFEVTPKEEVKRAKFWEWSPCACDPSPIHYKQSNIHELLCPDDNLKRNVYFRLNLSHDWADLATTTHSALATHALRTVSVWLRCATNEGHFAYRAYCLFDFVLSGLGGLEVVCWPFVAVGFFRAKKILSTPSFGREVKPFVPCRKFTACKRSLNVTWKSGIFRQNSSAISRPGSSSFHY